MWLRCCFGIDAKACLKGDCVVKMMSSSSCGSFVEGRPHRVDHHHDVRCCDDRLEKASYTWRPSAAGLLYRNSYQTPTSGGRSKLCTLASKRAFSAIETSKKTPHTTLVFEQAFPPVTPHLLFFPKNQRHLWILFGSCQTVVLTETS